MKKHFIIAICCLLIVCCSFALFQYKKTSNPKQIIASEIEEVFAATADTKQVQTVLKKWGYYTGKVDGINGPLTKAAVKKFQKRYGLKQDGIVGPVTAAKMGLSVSN